MKISINAHSSIRVDDMFFDPYLINNKPCKVFNTQTMQFEEDKSIINAPAKYIFITHTHYDHLSIKDIKNVSDDKTVIIATPDAEDKLSKHFNKNNLMFIRPNEAMELDGCSVSALPAYNINKSFHKKEAAWVGYIVRTSEGNILVAGDSDTTPELENTNCDILFLPIGGTYTMNYSEAANLTNKLKPKIVVPEHYGKVQGTGDISLGEKFAKLVDPKIETVILIK